MDEEQSSQSPPKESASARRKRSSSNNEFDDILGSITSRMRELSTNTTKEDMVMAFIQVLDIEPPMAEFFLESAAWNIETAVSVYLESAQAGQSGTSFVASQFSVGGAAALGITGGMGGGSANGSRKAARLGPDGQPRVERYRGIELFIHNLPEGWVAKVSRHSGEVYFTHTATGHRQSAVPPGMADLPPNHNHDSGSGNGVNGGGGDSMQQQQQQDSQSQEEEQEQQQQQSGMFVFPPPAPIAAAAEALGGGVRFGSAALDNSSNPFGIGSNSGSGGGGSRYPPGGSVGGYNYPPDGGGGGGGGDTDDNTEAAVADDRESGTLDDEM